MKGKELMEIVNTCDEIQVNCNECRGIFQRWFYEIVITDLRRPNLWDIILRVSAEKELADKNMSKAKFISKISLNLHGLADVYKYIKDKKKALENAEVFITNYGTWGKRYPIHEIKVIKSGKKKIAVIEYYWRKRIRD